MMSKFSLLFLACLTPCASAFTALKCGFQEVPSSSTCSCRCRESNTNKVMMMNTLMRHKYHANMLISNTIIARKRSSLAATTNHDNDATTDYYDETTTINNPLKSAGLAFVSASSKSLGMLFYNIGGMDHKEIQALLLEAGTQLVSAGESWTSDWDSVREAMACASTAFFSISNVFGSANIDESMPLGTLFEKIGRELEDISEISGCCSVGAPCSSPNLLAVEEHLIEVSRILKKNSVAATDEHMMCTLFREVAELFGEMAGKYVDNDGQKSEVTL